MKILAIRGENLASLAGKFELDLEREPLGRAGVFAIVGKTGAGKSTLLDAMCLALFDRTPRLAGRSNVLIGTEADDQRLSATDVRSILRRGVARGFAEVDFLSDDGRRYRARWELRRARNLAFGAVQNQQLSLITLDNNERVGGTRSEVANAIRERLGLSFDQFRRSVLLAQGEFAAFLRADGKERSELLERITGTRIYSDISRLAHQRAAEHKRQITELRAQLQHITILDDEGLARLHHEAASLDAHRAHFDEAKQAVAELATWHQTRRKLALLATQATTAVQLTHQRREALATQRQTLLARKRAATLAPLLQRETELDQRLAQQRTQLEARHRNHQGHLALAERVAPLRQQLGLAIETVLRLGAAPSNDLTPPGPHLGVSHRTEGATGDAPASPNQGREPAQLEASLAFTLDQQSALESALALATASATRLTLESPLRPLCEAWPSLRELVPRLGTKLGALATVLDVINRNTTAQQATNLELETLRPTHQAAVAQLLVAERTAATYQHKRAPSTDKLRRHEDQARTVVSDIAALARCREACLQLDATLARATVEHTALTEQAGKRRALRDELQQQADTQTAISAEAERALQRFRDAAGLADHRAALEPGQPCPLCGASEHPWGPGPDATPAPAVVKVLEAIGAQEQHVLELRKHEKRLANKRGATEADIQRTDEQLARLAAEAATATAEKAALEQAWRAQWAQLGELTLYADPTVPEAGALVAQRMSQAEEALQKARETRERAEAAVAAASEAFALMASKRSEVHALAARQLTLDGELATALAEARSLAARYEELHAEIMTLLGDYRAALAPLAVESLRPAEQLAAALQQQLQPLDPHQPPAAALAAGLPDALRASVDELRQHYKQLGASHSAWQAAVLPATDSLDALGEWRAQLDELAHAVAHALAQHDAALEVLRENEATTLAQQAELATMLQQGLRELELSRAEALALLGPGAPGMAELEATLNLADAEHAEQASIATERNAALGRHLDEHPQLPAALRAAATQASATLAPLAVELAGLAETFAASQAWGVQAAAALPRGESAVEASPLAPAGELTLDDTPLLFAISQHRARLEALAGALAAQQTEIQGRLAVQQDAHARLAQTAEQLRAAEAHATDALELAAAIGSHDGRAFRAFAQGLTLDALLAAANHHLAELAPRYALERVPRQDLELQVIDQDMANEVRSVNSLSGGESFLVSLALALGLSSLASHSVRVQSLFIDEGFGTLDATALDVALGVLDNLQASGRQVGIISHMPTITERVYAHVEVVAAGGGQSKVLTHGGGT